MEKTRRRDMIDNITLQKRGELVVLTGEIGPPCTHCRWMANHRQTEDGHYDRTKFCTAPAAQEFAYDPVRGKMKVKTVLTADEARSPTGLCGPEAQMFQPHTDRSLAAKTVSDVTEGIINATIITAGTGLSLGFLAWVIGLFG